MALNKYHLQVLTIEAGAILLAGCIAFMVMWARTLPQSKRAQAFLSDFLMLEVGKSTFSDARTLTERYGGIPWWVGNDSMQCTSERCVFRFVFENKPLSSTRVVPWTGLFATIDVRRGIVVGRYLDYMRYAKRPLSYHVAEVAAPEGVDTSLVAPVKSLMGFKRTNVDGKGTPSVISIGFEPPADPDKKRRAYALDLACLSRILGCGGPSAIFPPTIPYQGAPYQTNTQAW